MLLQNIALFVLTSLACAKLTFAIHDLTYVNHLLNTALT